MEQKVFTQSVLNTEFKQFKNISKIVPTYYDVFFTN